jgi:hypothetical protein
MTSRDVMPQGEIAAECGGRQGGMCLGGALITCLMPLKYRCNFLPTLANPQFQLTDNPLNTDLIQKAQGII